MSETIASVSIRGLSKSYLEGGQTRTVLNDVDADFEAGVIHAISGRSGSGKSTLLNLIAGIDRPNHGRIQVAGHRVTELNERQRTRFRRRNIGIIFQFFNLIDALTVAENVLLPLELNREKNRLARTLEALNRVGLIDRRDSFPTVLSGGEQQRVAIARGIVHRPRLILADEPTGNLDESSAETVLATLAKSRGHSTVIIVTHSPELAAKCDRQWQLRTGKLVMH